MRNKVKIIARIAGIEYTPFLCRELPIYPIDHISEAFSRENAFFLDTRAKKRFAISHWVSPKRTRSYPYARVYDTLSFQGKRVTIIPVIKDEGLQGDRDYIQYDTLTLMGLLGVHAILSYYKDAQKSLRSPNKITNDEVYTKEHQIFLVEAKHIKNQPLPSIEDIKDGLLRMVLLTNLKEVTIGQQAFSPVAGLRLTSEQTFFIEHLTSTQRETLHLLKKEAEDNQFYVIINETNLNGLSYKPNANLYRWRNVLC